MNTVSIRKSRSLSWASHQDKLEMEPVSAYRRKTPSEDDARPQNTFYQSQALLLIALEDDGIYSPDFI